MPYIKQSAADEISKGRKLETPGELNYVITVMCLDYLDSKGLSYQTINDIVGALEGAKMEFYRRAAAPYEDKKILEHGDVY